MGLLSDVTRARLKTVSTATLTTALFKRGLRNQFVQDVRPLNPAAGPMVGDAYTLRYIPAREDLNPITVFRDRRASTAQGSRGMSSRRRTSPSTRRSTSTS